MIVLVPLISLVGRANLPSCFQIKKISSFHMLQFNIQYDFPVEGKQLHKKKALPFSVENSFSSNDRTAKLLQETCAWRSRYILYFLTSVFDAFLIFFKHQQQGFTIYTYSFIDRLVTTPDRVLGRYSATILGLRAIVCYKCVSQS